MTCPSCGKGKVLEWQEVPLFLEGPAPVWTQRACFRCGWYEEEQESES